MLQAEAASRLLRLQATWFVIFGGKAVEPDQPVLLAVADSC